MASLTFKPGEKFNVSDWHDSNNFISTNAERQRNASHEIRQSSRSLDLITANRTKWDQHNNETRLEERLNDINEWRKVITRTINDTQDEINNLEAKKHETEECLRDKHLNTDVVTECLMLREGRNTIDYVRDNVEAELIKENEIIEKIKKALQNRIDEANQQSSLLREAKIQLDNDHRDKTEADEIDSTCLALNNNSSGICHRPNVTRVHPESTTPQSWNQFSQYNKDRATTEIRSSVTLREATDAEMTNAKNELEAQRIATEFAYRKRIHEFEMREKELIWQRERTLDEIAEMERDIRNLEQAIRDKEGPSKVAHTRLEERTHRRNVELCRDEPQLGLTAEVHQLEATKKTLREKLEQAHHARHALYQNLHRIDLDLETKRNSLKIDRKCLDVRRRLTVPSNKFVEKLPRDDFNRSFTDQATTDAQVKLKQLDLA